MDEYDHIILSKEFKYALKRYDLNLPGGAIDPGETPLDCAKRETEEELGYTANEWISLGHIHPLTTIIKETEYLFLARKLIKTRKYDDIWEEIEEVRLPYQKVLEMAMNSEITHAGSVTAILKAQKYL
jgi:ADP-ribose pyrophosphatase